MSGTHHQELSRAGSHVGRSHYAYSPDVWDCFFVLGFFDLHITHPHSHTLCVVFHLISSLRLFTMASATSPSLPKGIEGHQPTSTKKGVQFASTIPEDNGPEDNHRLRLERTFSNTSHHDMADVHYVETGDGDEVYNKFTEKRKMIITLVLSFCGFLAPVSSTTVLSAVPEVAATFQCDGAIINLSNALYMLFMGLSPCFYGPIGNMYGRRWVRNYPNTAFIGLLDFTWNVLVRSNTTMTLLTKH